MAYKFEQRELEFRAWDGTGMMSIHDYRGNVSTFFAMHESDHPIMQWTGLVDKTGRDIYEGDVIANESYSRVVEFKPNAGSFRMAHIHMLYRQPFEDIWQPMEQAYINEFGLEVIGNVFENPELIPDGI